MKRILSLLMVLVMMGFLAGCGSEDGRAEEKGADGDTENVESSSDNANTATRKGRMRDDEGNPIEGDDSGVIPVEVTNVTRGAISSYLLYSSTLETEQTVDIYPRIGGLVVAIYKDESDKVGKNAPLLQIEKDTYDLDEKNAKLEYEKQKTNFARLEKLQAEQLLSEEEFQNARLTLDQSKIAWERAALLLKQTTVRSPIPGVIGERTVRLGDRVQTSTKLYSVTNLAEKIVPVYIPQSEFSKTFKGQAVIISSDVIPGVKLKGYVKRKSPIIDPQSGTFKVTIALKDPKNILSPGMFVRAELVVDTHEDAQLIPKSALIYENDRSYFYVARGDSAAKFELVKGFEDSEKVEVLNDLPSNTKVVVLGQNGLKEGTRVKVSSEKTYAWQGKTQASLARF